VLAQPELLRQRIEVAADGSAQVNVKALIPFKREVVSLDQQVDVNGKNQHRIRSRTFLSEDVVFGVLTPSQLGHMPHMDVCFTEDELEYSKDTYCFVSLRGGEQGVEPTAPFSPQQE
jgi:hypothetical protein